MKLYSFLHDIWWNILQTKLIQLSPKACLALPGAILYMEKSSMRLIFTCLLVYWKWKIFHSVNDTLSLQHLFLLGQNFHPPPISTPAINPLAHTFHIFQTDGSLGMNYTWFHSQPKPRHNLITIDKGAHRSASFGHKGLLHFCIDKVLNWQGCGLNISQKRKTF